MPIPDDEADPRGRHRQLRVDAGEDPEWREGLIDGSEGRLPSASGTTPDRSWTSRMLHRLGEATAHAWAGLVVGLAVVAWWIVGVVVGFPTWWQATLYSVSSAVTLVMVFALQHTQTREQSATQRKLDELLRTQPSADGALIAVEQAPDQELEALADMNREDRQRAAGGADA